MGSEAIPKYCGKRRRLRFWKRHPIKANSAEILDAHLAFENLTTSLSVLHFTGCEVERGILIGNRSAFVNQASIDRLVYCQLRNAEIVYTIIDLWEFHLDIPKWPTNNMWSTWRATTALSAAIY